VDGLRHLLLPEAVVELYSSPHGRELPGAARAILQVFAQPGAEFGIDVFSEICADLLQYLMAQHESLTRIEKCCFLLDAAD